MNEYLILMIKKSYFFEFINDKNIKNIYNDSNKIKTYFRKIFSRICKPILFLFFDKWKNELNTYENIILLDSGYNSYITKYIKKKNPNIKIIFYYWNIINDKNKWILNDKNIDSFWTFDESDSKKYSIKYSPQFYSICKLKDVVLENDVCFLGAAKDREEIILDIKEKLEVEKIKTNVIISYIGDRMKTYSEYLDMIAKSKAILDVVGCNQTGITLRCLEAINYRKKLITNNKDIINYSFYNKNNIFIIDKDNIKEIKKFLETPYEEISKENIEKYSYEKWIENLVERNS